MAHQNDTTITPTKPKKSLLKKRVSSMFGMGTSLDQVKVEVSLSDSESDEEKTVENAVEEVIETVVEKAAEIDLDVDIEIDKKKKKSSKDSTQNIQDEQISKENERKEKKLQRNQEKASRARDARAVYANMRFENKAKIYMEEQLRIKEQQDAVYKENEQLRIKLLELESKINSNIKNEPTYSQPVIQQQPIKKPIIFL